MRDQLPTKFYQKLVNAEINGTSFLSSGIKYKWYSVKASGLVFCPKTSKAMTEMVDDRKMKMSSFDGIISLTDGSVQVWDKGKRNKDKELVLKYFPEFTKKDLDLLDKMGFISMRTQRIRQLQTIKPATKPIKPVTIKINPSDLNELALIASDFESSDCIKRYSQAA